MPKFQYKVKDAQGQALAGELEAFDKNSAINQLQRQGYFILSVTDALISPVKPVLKSGKTASSRKFPRQKIKLGDLLTFANQLGTMLEAGVTLLRSLEVIKDQVDSQQFFVVLNRITGDVEQGSSLSEALAKHEKVFNQFWVSLVEVGEASGTMPLVLRKLAFYLEQQAAFRSTIISAIMYPIVLFVVSMGAVSFFALFVGPRFEAIFTSMGVELPMITIVLLTIFRFIKEKFLLIISSIALGAFLFRKWSRTASGRRQLEHFLFGLPVVGHIYKLIIIERFTSQMAILVDSGVPILYALDITERLVDNLTCAKVVNHIKESVRQGELLVAPMQRSDFFPSMATQMISVGEETGELSKMLKHVAGYYQETVETFMKRLGTLIEPFMLVFMGGIIGVIVLAMFLPMFNIAQLGGASPG